MLGVLTGQGCPAPSNPIDDGDDGANTCGLGSNSCPDTLVGTPVSIAAVDLDQDGDADLAVADSSTDSVVILRNNGAGKFSRIKAVAIGTDLRGVAVADLDADTKPELIAIHGGSISVLKNKGSASFESPRTGPVASDPVYVTAGDVSGDGKPDLLTANSTDGTVSVVFNLGNLLFTVATSLQAGSNPQWVTPADLDGDGDVDLAVANSGSGTVSILRNQGAGFFFGGTSVSAGSHPRAVVAADFNNDGVIDLAAADEATFDDTSVDTVRILTNSGNATFMSGFTLQVGVNPQSLATTDMNGDGLPDIVVANYGADSNSSSLAVFLATGNGRFATGTAYPVGVGPRMLVVADLNGKTGRDVAVANFESSSVSLLVNNGAGLLTPNTD